MKLATTNVIIIGISLTLTEALPKYMVTIQIVKPNVTPLGAGILLTRKLVVSTGAVQALVPENGRVAAGCKDIADLGCESARRIHSVVAHPKAPKKNEDGFVIDDNIGLIICKKPFDANFYPLPYQSQPSIRESKCQVTHTATSEVGSPITIKTCTKQTFLKNIQNGVCSTKDPKEYVALAAIVCYKTGDSLEKNKGLLIGFWYRFLQNDPETYGLKLFPYRSWIQKNAYIQFKLADSLMTVSILLSLFLSFV